MLKLSAKIREEVGSRVKNLRKTGQIPAVLYGPGVKSENIVLDYRDFMKIYEKAGESTLINLDIAGEKEKQEHIVLVYDAVKDPVSDKLIHIDFYQMRMDKPISVEIPLNFIGVSQAVQQDGGILVKNMQEVEIEALPKDLIHEIEIDISSLKTFDDYIYIKDLKVPETIKILANEEDIVVSVSAPRTEEEMEEELSTPIDEGAPAPEVEEKGKKDEEITGDAPAPQQSEESTEE